MMKREQTSKPEAVILDGRKVRNALVPAMKEGLEKSGAKPTLVIIQVGSLEESSAYIKQKKNFAYTIGAIVAHKQFPDRVSEHDLIATINELNVDRAVHGIILQLPIPPHLDKQKIIDAIALSKDVDGLTSENKKRFEAGDRSAVVPATARGVLSLLKGYGISVKGKKATVLGRSALVGAPIATLLAREGATVTVCHSETLNVPEKSREADILVVAIGRPRFVTSEYVKVGAVVVDVGINSVSGEKLEDEIPKRTLVGDVDFESVKTLASAISPVPGGVGPMTVLSLFENLVSACEMQSVS